MTDRPPPDRPKNRRKKEGEFRKEGGGDWQKEKVNGGGRGEERKGKRTRM